MESSSERLPPELKEKIEKFLSLPEERRNKIIHRYLSYFVKVADEDPERALTEFVEWLLTDDGMVVFPHMWRPEYAEDIIDLTSNAMKIVVKIMEEELSKKG